MDSNSEKEEEMTLKAFDSMGQEVNTGDTVLTPDNRKAIFRRATRARSYGKSGKVTVTWVGSEYRSECEYYDKVFDLVVEDVRE